jgi:hypothetical protein
MCAAKISAKLWVNEYLTQYHMLYFPCIQQVEISHKGKKKNSAFIKYSYADDTSSFTGIIKA